MPWEGVTACVAFRPFSPAGYTESGWDPPWSAQTHSAGDSSLGWVPLTFPSPGAGGSVGTAARGSGRRVTPLPHGLPRGRSQLYFGEAWALFELTAEYQRPTQHSQAESSLGLGCSGLSSCLGVGGRNGF